MAVMTRAGRLGSALVAAGLLYPALAVGAGVEPAMATPGQTATPAWGGCENLVTDAYLPAAQCATVGVPVDYADPGGPQAQLALIKFPATGSRIGSLLVNPGVGFDPRGVGYSTPQLRCRTDAEFDAWRREPMVDFSQAGVAGIESLYQSLADQCLERMGRAFLAGVGTDSAARDMDVVRQALGEEQINYLGYSYGTQLGTAYVEAFPDRVRAMVLDGAIDPELDAIDSLVNQMAGFQVAFTSYAADCAQHPACPLGTDPGRWVARYHQLVNPLVESPGRTSDPRGLSYADAITGTVNALYTPSFWKYLTSGLLGLQRGTDAGDLLLLADNYQGRDAEGRYDNAQDAFTAIRCVDSPTPSDPAVWAAADLSIREVAPFLSYGDHTGFAPRDVCAFWPVPPTTIPAAASPAPPGGVVVVSTTRDPATPYQAGVDLARQLGAPLITFDGTQHTVVFDGEACVDATVQRFLIDRISPADLSCEP